MDVEMPTQETLKVAVTYRVCQHWRANIFARLNAHRDLDVVVFHGQSIPGTKCVNGENLEGFEHKEHRSIRIPFTETWAFQPFIGRSLRAYDPDVILAEGGSNLLTNFFVFLYAKLHRKPVVWWTLGEVRGRTFKGLVRGMYRRFVVWQERMSDTYLGYSDVALNYFRRMGYPQKDCFVAVNCVDTDRVFAERRSRRTETEQLLQKLHLEGRRVILFVGAFTRPKRIDRLVRVFDGLRSEFPDIVLLLVGDGVCRQEIEDLVNERGMQEQVIFAGNVVDHVSDYYALGNVFVLPGLGGLAISEAMAHGMPVICTIADGCEVNYVVDGETGFRLFSQEDEEVMDFLDEKLRLLFSDEQLLLRMSHQSEQRIRDLYNVNSYISGIVDAIKHADRKRK